MTEAASQSSNQSCENKINTALSLLRKNDYHLLKEDVNERSITHKLAIYLEQQFKDWDVDCEYNRNGHDKKELDLGYEQICNDDEHAKTVFPDIIIHHRGKDENLIVIEVKKSTSQVSKCFDIKKLIAFKKQLKYQYAMFLEIKTGRDCTSSGNDFYSLDII
jgi:hypothetical protein